MLRKAVGLAVVAGVTALARAPSAEAHANGIVTDSCGGCHGPAAGGSPIVTVTADRSAWNPGDSVTFTLTIQWPSIRDGGAFISTGGVGTLRALAGEGLAVNAQGLTHTAPKTASNGAVTFRFGWQAPSKPGAVDVFVAALAGNGNNASSGDAPGGGEFQWVFGCTATTFYVDLDRDGYGTKSLGIRLGCVGDSAPEGYAATDGDCDENDEKVHPGATEICNMKDDDCNGQTDENAPAVMMWPDADGDGYYGSTSGTPKMGCGNLAGYAARGGDCNDNNAAIHPGATEVCNLLDDDCDGQVDERVRPICGVGWCARYSSSCDPADCVPGPPAKETCNFFDDDCDGENDNGACPAGMICSGDQCVASGDGAGGAAGTGGAAGVGGSPSGAGGTSGAAGPGGASGRGGGQTPSSGCAVGGSPGNPGPSSALAVCLGLCLLARRQRR